MFYRLLNKLVLVTIVLSEYHYERGYDKTSKRERLLSVELFVHYHLKFRLIASSQSLRWLLNVIGN